MFSSERCETSCFWDLSEVDGGLAIRLRQADGDKFVARGRHVLADEVGAQRQLAVSAIDEDGKLDRRGASEREDGFDRGARGAAGKEDVVHEDNVLPGDVEIDFRAVDFGELAELAEVVAVKRDVKLAEGK